MLYSKKDLGIYHLSYLLTLALNWNIRTYKVDLCKYKNASQISSKTRVDINPNILTCSSIKNQGITEIWNFIEKFIDQIKQNEKFDKLRNEQKIKSLWADVSLRFSEYLEKKFKNKKKVNDLVRKIENNQISSDEVGNIIYDHLTKKKFD